MLLCNYFRFRIVCRRISVFQDKFKWCQMGSNKSQNFRVFFFNFSSNINAVFFVCKMLVCMTYLWVNAESELFLNGMGSCVRTFSYFEGIHTIIKQSLHFYTCVIYRYICWPVEEWTKVQRLWSQIHNVWSFLGFVRSNTKGMLLLNNTVT